MSISIDGSVVDSKDPDERPQVNIPYLPIRNNKTNDSLQVFISNYFVDSLFSSFMKVHPIKFIIKQDDLPDDFPIQLDTSTLDLIFPGMVALYGDNIPVELNIEAI